MKFLTMIWHTLTGSHQMTETSRETDQWGFTSIFEKCDGCGYHRHRWGKFDD